MAEISQAELNRALSFLKGSIRKVFDDASLRGRPALEAAFIGAVNACCSQLIEAAKVPPRIADALREFEVHRARERQKIAEELKKARNRLNSVKRKVFKQETRLKNLILAESYFENLRTAGYPNPPAPMIRVTPSHVPGVPDCPGIYFIWRNDIIVYVGQSICLYNRLIMSHQALRHGDMVSWLSFNIEDLNFAEAYYIGALRPERNFAVKQAARLK